MDPQSFICTYASAALLVLDDQARITFANPAAERLFAGTNQALSGRTLDHVLGPGKLVERIKEALKLQNAHAFRITEILTLNPSDKRAVECLVDIVRSSDPEGMNCILQLRTDLPDEAGHEKLDLLARQRQLALNAADLGWWHYDPATEISTYDERFKEIFQVAGSSKPNEEILKKLHPDDRDRVWAKVTESLDPRKNAPYTVEYRIILDDGSIKWIEAHGLATFEGEGDERRPVSFVGTVADITEQRKMESAFHEQATLFKAISDSTGDAIFAKDLEGRLTFANPATLKLVEKSLEEVLGKTDLEILEDKEAARRVMANDRRIMNSGKAEDLEEAIPSRDGDLRVWFSRKVPYTDVHGSVIGLLGISRDITDRTKAQEQLRITLESIGDGFFALDESWRFVYINAHAERILGVSRAEILGGNFWDVFPLARGTMLESEYRRSAAGEIRDFVNYYEPWSRWFHNRCFPREGGGITVYFQDVTEARLSERRLEEQEAELRLIADNAPLYLAHCDSETRYRFVNKAYAQRFDLTPNDIIGKRIVDLLGDAAYSEIKEFVDSAISGHKVDFEIPIPYPHGTRIMRADYVPDPGPAPTGFVAVIQDVTDRRAVESALKEADRRKDEFLAILAHELRNPLAPLQNALNIFKHGSLTVEMVKKLQPLMSRQVEHLTRLVDDLLDVARITTGKIVLRREPIDLREVARRAVELNETFFAAKRQTLEVSISEVPVTVSGDAVRLVQVIGNLLNNSSKYTQEGGHVKLTLDVKDGAGAVVVEDNGIGLSGEMLPRVFDIFAQADSSLAHTTGGLGLGLSLVKRLVEKHGGSVSAFSSGLGTGSRFEMRLPLCAPVPEARSRDDLSTGSASRRILVVDDNKDSADTVASLLEVTGHDVRTEYDGAAALAAIGDFNPEVILLDIGLPGESGYDVARRIRVELQRDDLLLCAMTGYGRDEDRERCREAGFDAHLVKPVDFEKLEKLLRDFHTEDRRISLHKNRRTANS